MKMNNNRSAFPLTHDKFLSELGRGRGEYEFIGLTKREYFAAMAMQGICASPVGDKYHVNGGWLHPETVAKNAISIADELLKQLES